MHPHRPLFLLLLTGLGLAVALARPQFLRGEIHRRQLAPDDPVQRRPLVGHVQLRRVDTVAVIGDAQANELLSRPYRAPWVYPV